jgi:ABC-2 type transport system permease protein
MKALLGIEWLKIKRYRTFWVLGGLFLLLLPLLNYEIANGFMKIGNSGKNGINILSSAYSFPQVWGNLGFWGSYFIIFLAILVIILTTNEYSFRTNRQNVIDGWSRLQFFHAKILLVVALSVIATLYLFLLGLLFGGITSGSLGSVFDEFCQVGYFFLLSLDYLGFALLIAIWIKRSGLAIGLFLLYSMMIETMAVKIINHYIDMPYGNLMPLQASDELLPFPLLQIAKGLIPMGGTLSMTTYVFTAMAWCAVYYLAGRIILMKRDW